MLAYIQCEAHIINQLSANILLGTDVLRPQKFIINYEEARLSIGACENASCPFKMRARTSIQVKRKVLARQRTKLPPNAVTPIPVIVSGSDEAVPYDLKFTPTFESSKLPNGGIYSHLTDANI